MKNNDLRRLFESGEGVKYFLHQLLRYEEDTKWRLTFRPVPGTDDSGEIHVFTYACGCLTVEACDRFLRAIEATGLCPFIGVVR